MSYESDTDFSAELPVTTPHADIASAFSSIGASASHFFKGAFEKGKKLVDDFEEKRAAAREAAEREAAAQQQAAEAERERAAQEFEQNDAEQPVSVDVADATTSFEAPQPSPADVAGETATFETQQPVDSTVSFDATMTFEKQGTAIAEPLSAPVEDEPAAPDTVEDQSVAEQVAADSSEQEPEPWPPKLRRRMSRGPTLRRSSPCPRRVIPAPRLPMLLRRRPRRRCSDGSNLVSGVAAPEHERSRPGIRAGSHALCVSAGLGPRSLDAFDAAGQCRLAHLAVRPSRPFGSG